MGDLERGPLPHSYPPHGVIAPGQSIMGTGGGTNMASAGVQSMMGNGSGAKHSPSQHCGQLGGSGINTVTAQTSTKHHGKPRALE